MDNSPEEKLCEGCSQKDAESCIREMGYRYPECYYAAMAFSSITHLNEELSKAMIDLGESMSKIHEDLSQNIALALLEKSVLIFPKPEKERKKKSQDAKLLNAYYRRIYL